MSVIAVFIVIGGSAYAGSKINGKTLKANSVSAKKLKCPGAAPDREGPLCYGAPQAAGFFAAQATCASQSLRLPSSSEALLLVAALGGESWADDIIREGANGLAASASGGVVFARAVADVRGFRSVTG